MANTTINNLPLATPAEVADGSSVMAGSVKGVTKKFLLQDLQKVCKGDKGDAGPAGPQGPQGDRGATGPAGAKGDKGDVGAQGPEGPRGQIGDRGPTGPQGAKGDAGIQGPKGDRGDAGPAGPKGPIGATGPAGPQGPAGPKGDKGDPGQGGFSGMKSLALVKDKETLVITGDHDGYLIHNDGAAGDVGLEFAADAPEGTTVLVWNVMNDRTIALTCRWGESQLFAPNNDLGRRGLPASSLAFVRKFKDYWVCDTELNDWGQGMYKMIINAPGALPDNKGVNIPSISYPPLFAPKLPASVSVRLSDDEQNWVGTQWHTMDAGQIAGNTQWTTDNGTALKGPQSACQATWEGGPWGPSAYFTTV